MSGQIRPSSAVCSQYVPKFDRLVGAYAVPASSGTGPRLQRQLPLRDAVDVDNHDGDPATAAAEAAIGDSGAPRTLPGAKPDRVKKAGGSDEVRYSVLSVKAIWLVAALIVLVGVAMAVGLLRAFGGGGEQARNQLEAIKTAGAVVVATGGFAALVLAARRQRSSEIALKQKDRDQALQERVASAAESDATERRITELYTKAVEQIGSDKAPVRLGGLYALERLAQANEHQRQTIVNVLCAYLRMPYYPSDANPDAIEADGIFDEIRAQIQEREVRLTAQRLLLEHLQPRDNPSSPLASFWDDMDLNLTGAVLVEFSLRDCQVRSAIFRAAQFTGPFADFSSVIFSGNVTFDSASFAGEATFGGANFCGDTSFWHATFANRTHFDDATFVTDVGFGGATFSRAAYFGGARFEKDVYLGSTRFHDRAIFSTAAFGGHVHTNRSTEFAVGTPTEIMPVISPEAR